MSQDECSRSQKNTCRDMGGQFHAFKDKSVFDPVQNTCASLGYSRPGNRGQFLKPQ